MDIYDTILVAIDSFYLLLSCLILSLMALGYWKKIPNNRIMMPILLLTITFRSISCLVYWNLKYPILEPIISCFTTFSLYLVFLMDTGVLKHILPNMVNADRKIWILRGLGSLGLGFVFFTNIYYASTMTIGSDGAPSKPADWLQIGVSAMSGLFVGFEWFVFYQFFRVFTDANRSSKARLHRNQNVKYLRRAKLIMIIAAAQNIVSITVFTLLSFVLHVDNRLYQLVFQIVQGMIVPHIVISALFYQAITNINLSSNSKRQDQPRTSKSSTYAETRLSDENHSDPQDTRILG